jgi:hypothetical protein
MEGYGEEKKILGVRHLEFFATPARPDNYRESHSGGDHTDLTDRQGFLRKLL